MKVLVRLYLWSFVVIALAVIAVIEYNNLVLDAQNVQTVEPSITLELPSSGSIPSKTEIDAVAMAVFNEVGTGTSFKERVLVAKVLLSSYTDGFNNAVISVRQVPNVYVPTEYKKDVGWYESVLVATTALMYPNQLEVGDSFDRATHFHKVGEHPEWAKYYDMVEIGTVGNHVFYFQLESI